MYITHIELYQYRNAQQIHYAFSEGLVVVSGNNGLGKTNLLESIFVGCMNFSPRTRKEKDQVLWGQKEFSIKIRGSLNQESFEQLFIWKEGTGREIRNAGVTLKVQDKLPGKFPCVWFGPDDITLITGGPVLRRRFLDVLLAQTTLGYLEIHREYQQILKQRNFLLKEGSLQSSQETFHILSEQLAEKGAFLIKARLEFCKEFLPWIGLFYNKISQGKDSFHLKYQGSFKTDFEGASKESIQQAFFEILTKNQSEEEKNGQTLYGPHRDNLLFLLAGRPASQFGSQGQKRLCALSLRLAEAACLKLKKNVVPLLLLDDVFAELDPTRRLVLSDCIKEYEQAIIATPWEADLSFVPHQSLSLKRPD